MNTSLFDIVKKIVDEQSDSILSEPRRVSAFLADLARDEPKPQKSALLKCLEHGFAQILRNATETVRTDCKQSLAQRLHSEEGFDLLLCEETVDLLAAVLFGGEQKNKVITKNHCKNCGKELQEGWKACPYCGTSGIPSLQPKASTSKPKTSNLQPNVVENQYGCESCKYIDNRKTRCNYYGLSIFKAIKLDCGYITPNKNTHQKSQKSGVKNQHNCESCKYADNRKRRCNYYGLSIYEAVKLDCGY